MASTRVDYNIDFRTMLREVQREIGMRRSVYGRRVMTGEMKQEVADYNIAIMQAIAEHLIPLAEAEQAQVDKIVDYKEPKLF